MKKLISIFTPCYNEEGNLEKMYSAITGIMQQVDQYDYEYVIIDNCSTDRTPEILREIASKDKRVKVNFNVKNFGPGRSGCYGFLQTTGEAAICLACDFQDPPELIPEFIKRWEEGYKVVWGRKSGSEEGFLIKTARELYYKIIRSFSDVKQYDNVSGYGLYDKEVMNLIREVDDPVPNFRHLVADFGYEVSFIDYYKPNRQSGKSSYNFLRYLDTALSSLVSTSKAPLRMAMMLGFLASGAFFIIGLIYFVLKLMFWNSFVMGSAPLVIGMFFFGSVQLFFIGILGEYIGSIFTRVTKRPMVVEKARLNFEETKDKGIKG